jgi:hypothetical protein
MQDLEIPTRGPLDGVADSALLTTEQVAALRVFGGVPKLNAARGKGIGPRHFKLDGRVFYSAGSLREFLNRAMGEAAAA